jgi:mono/diheme cytochrome c family protein
VVIVATGTFQAWLQVGSWEALLQTAYGLSVLAKVVLMLGMVALASFHVTTSYPRLAARFVPEAIFTRMNRWSRAAFRAELGVGLVVLLIAAYLTGTPPGREELARRTGEAAQAGPVDRRLQAQALNAQVRITPATVGVNRFSVELAGVDPASVERVQLTLTYLDQELGSQPLVLQPAIQGTAMWQLEAPALSQAGSWQAELLVRRTAQDDARTAFRFVVAGPGGATSRAAAPLASYPLLPSPMVSVAYALMALGLAVVVVGFRRGGRRMRQVQTTVMGAGLVVVLAGGYVYAQELRNGVPIDIANVRNPLAADSASLARGQAIYEQAGCVSCHGDTGRGDGPAGLRLVPRPADFRVHMAAGHTDGQLFYWVSSGVQGTAMPAFGDRLSEQERWDVINYIRTFAVAGSP